MSKKITFLVVAFLATFALTAQADNMPDSIHGGVHPFKYSEYYTTKLANWSIFVDAGFSHFDGDNGVKLSTAEQMSLDAGLGVHYDFTPLWGLYIDWHTTTYGQHMFDKKQAIGSDLISSGGRSLGHLNTVGGGITLNLVNAFFPRRKQDLFNVYLQAGGGVAIYDYHGGGYNYNYNPTTGALTDMIPVTDAYTNGKGKWITQNSPEFSKYNTVGYIMGGVLVDFHVTRVFHVGLRAYYDYFLNDYVDGGTSPVNKNNKNNDGSFACDVEFHFNIIAKSNSHVRNIPELNYFYEVAEKLEQKEQEAAGHMKDTLVISHKDTLVSIMQPQSQIAQVKEQDQRFYVYFDNNQDNVNDAGMITIQQVAALLQADTTLCAEITGYCDNTGNVAYNKALSERRANNVLNEFIEEYEFDGERAYTVSKGIIVGKRSTAAFGPNRRVEIRLVSKEKFAEMKAAHEEEVKAEKEGKQILKDAAEKAAPAVEAAKQTVEKAAEQVKNVVEDIKQAAKDAEKKVVTVKENETLSSIARREYGNTHCWIYIYEANAIRLSGASSVRPGMMLYLPELTDEQKSITKEEAHSRYEARK